MTPEEFAASIELVTESPSAPTAKVIAMALNGERFPGATITGIVRGPYCELATTLPATFRLQSPMHVRGACDLAMAKVQDPIAWTEPLPALYTAELELRRNSRVVAACQRQFGFHALSTARRSFYQAGKRIVWRAVSHRAIDEPLRLLDWKEAPAQLFIERPSDGLCAQASRLGVMILAALQTRDTDLEAELKRLRRHAAVGMIAIRGDVPPTLALQRAKGAEAPLAIWRDGDLAAGEIPVWSSAVVVESESAAVLAQSWPNFHLPTLAFCPRRQHNKIAYDRLLCDELQAALAPHGEFAGFIV